MNRVRRSLLSASAPLLLAALSGCTDDPAPGADVGPGLDAAADDAAPRSDGGVEPDAGAITDAGLDAGGGADAAPTPPDLIGTRFEGVGIAWSAPLELCNTFRGRDLDDARASRLHVTLAPAARPGLGRGQLAVATLEGGLVRRGPFAADQAPLGVVTSSLADWSLTDPTGAAVLTARIVHRVAGGELVEALRATRDGSDRAPVRYEALREVAFSFVDTSTPAAPRTIPLEPCGVGAEDRVSSVEVMVAEGPGGESIAVLREVRSQRVVAGSAPVTLVRGQVARSSDPWTGWAAQGHWAWTYAASLHNWNEQSVLDFTRDAGLWHSVFAPGAPVRAVQAPIARVELSGVNGPGDGGELTLVTVPRGGGAEQRTVFTALSHWRSVGPDVRVPTCAGARIDVVVLSENTVLQVTRCGDDSIEAVMPVLFAFDHRRNGEVLEGRELSPAQVMGRSGVRAVISGRSAVEVAVWDAATYIVRLTDPAGDDMYTGLAEVAGGPGWLRPEAILSRRSADGAVRFALTRRYAWQGVGESSIFAPVRLVVEHAGLRHEVEAYDRLVYTNTHHNWRDELVATTETHRVHWRVEFDFMNGGLTEYVSVARLSDGAVVLPETVIVE